MTSLLVPSGTIHPKIAGLERLYIPRGSTRSCRFKLSRGNRLVIGADTKFLVPRYLVSSTSYQAFELIRKICVPI